MDSFGEDRIGGASRGIGRAEGCSFCSCPWLLWCRGEPPGLRVVVVL